MEDERKTIMCQCGREQMIVPIYNSGGVTEIEAQRIGWRVGVDGRWYCPLCAKKG